jgi:hypothetical protein
MTCSWKGTTEEPWWNEAAERLHMALVVKLYLAVQLALYTAVACCVWGHKQFEQGTHNNNEKYLPSKAGQDC